MHVCKRGEGWGRLGGCKGMEAEHKWGKSRGSEKRGTGAGITVTTDGLQERVPISSLRVKQRKGGGEELDREAK